MSVATKKKANKKQNELTGMPPIDTAAKLALQLVERDEEISAAYESREDVEKRLIETLEATGRLRIKVEGRLFEIKRTKATEKIQIRKDREKKKTVLGTEL